MDDIQEVIIKLGVGSMEERKMKLFYGSGKYDGKGFIDHSYHSERFEI